MSITWTDTGQRYAERCRPGSDELARVARNLRLIRQGWGFPHWEIKKALYNAEGDLRKALEQLVASHV